MPKPPTVVGTREIVRMLGISRSYAAQLVNSKGFPDPTVRIGRTRGWLKTDVEAWARAAGRQLHADES